MKKKEAFLKAVQEQEGAITRIASAYTNTPEDRNDLVQDIYFQLWRSFDSFANRSGIGTWIYRVALNTAIQHLKITKRNAFTSPATESIFALPDVMPENDEEKQLLFRQMLEQLNLLDKGIVLLYLENKSYAEIALITGLTESNAGTRLSRIKERMRTKVEQNK